MPEFSPSNVYYDIRLIHPSGFYVGMIDRFLSCNYTLTLNDIGVLSLVLPGNVNPSLFLPDSRIEVWRTIGYGQPQLEGQTQFLVQTIKRSIDENRDKTIEVTAYSLNHILKRRVVAYNSANAFAKMTDQADDMCKQIVRQNLGSLATDTTRSLATYLSVQGDTSQLASITKDFSFKNVLDVLKEISDYTWNAGTPIYFDIVATTPPLGMEFRVYVNARGSDRRASRGNNNPMIGYSSGSIGAYTITDDYNDEATYVYALGAQYGSTQATSVAEDLSRSNRSPYGRREIVINNGDAGTASLLTEAQAALVTNRPRKIFEGRLLSIPGCLYGVHWGYGDIVRVDADDEQFDCMISSVHVSFTKDAESIEAALRNTYA